MNYKIVLDKNELEKFIENVLPDLVPGETFYVCLFARKKYYSGIRGDKQQLKRFTSSKELLFSKIKQLECELGSYKQNDVIIPQEALALYITPNPRSYKKATVNSVKTFVKILTNDNYNVNFNPHQKVMDNLQVSISRKIYYDMDFDNVKISDLKDKIESFINASCLTYVETRGGFHLLIKPNEIDNKFKKRWHQSIASLGADVKGDNLLPVPGCTQGNFIPRIV